MLPRSRQGCSDDRAVAPRPTQPVADVTLPTCPSERLLEPAPPTEHDPARGQHLFLSQVLNDLSQGSLPWLLGSAGVHSGKEAPAGISSRVSHQPQLQAGCSRMTRTLEEGGLLCHRGGHRPCGQSCQQCPPMLTVFHHARGQPARCQQPPGRCGGSGRLAFKMTVAVLQAGMGDGRPASSGAPMTPGLPRAQSQAGSPDKERFSSSLDYHCYFQ